MTRTESIKVLNVDVLNTDGEELLQEYTQGCLFTPNIDHFVLLQKDNEFYQAYHTAEYVVLDSQVIYLLFKLLGKSFKAKIAGADFFPHFCEHHKYNDTIRVFILGGIDDVAEKVRDRLNVETGRTIVVGAYSPPIDFENNETEHTKIISLINATNANVLAVALGTPKQEKWIYRNRKYLSNVTMFMGIGATLDFMIGKQKRAPRWIQNIGFEWFYRLLHDPKRLMKRYLIRDIQFFYYLIKDVLRLYRNPFEK
jgi:N-acetylglucosaminyldiphosphoundecaprenol N-acetyl-beta-D-mannosaminyltransferase